MEGEGEAGSAAAAKSGVTIDKQLLAVLQRLISGQSDDVPEEYKDLKQLDRQSAFDRYVSVVDGLVSTWKTLPKEVDAAVLRRQNENLVQVVDTLKTELVQLRGKISKNVELENEVDRLCRELDEATGGVNKRGYLNKYRVRENIIGTKWVKRFFVLSGSSLSYFGSEQDKRPWKTMSLEGCTVRYEGTKKNGQFHVFGIYLANSASSEDEVSNSDLLIRLSSSSEADAIQWIDLLQQACEMADAGSSASDDREGGIENAITRSDGEAQPSKLPNLKSRSSSHDEPVIQETQGGVLSSTSLQLRRMMALLSSQGKKRGVQKHKYKAESYPASRPMHRDSQPSLLSNESPRQNYRGFLNLGLIILFVTHFRLIIENVLKYGLLISTPRALPTDAERPHHLTAILIMLNAFPLITLVTEKLMARAAITDQQYLIGNFANITVALFLPLFYVYFSDMSPITGALFLMQAIIHVLKLISYCHVNRDVRLAKIAGVELSSMRREPLAETPRRKSLVRSRSLVQSTDTAYEYPQNVTVSNLYWFLLAPTLSYQLNYPRTPKVRWDYILAYAGRMLLSFGLMVFVIEQYVTPLVQSTVEPLSNMHFLAAFERLLKLALPSTYVWLLMFYTYFHLWLNLLAEITRFGDRVFYKDWWNARSIETYWRLWNLPVHHWMIQHMYFPALRFGISKQHAVMLVFLLSAILHEVIISIPLHSIKVYAFIGMLAQAPLVLITKQLDRLFDNPFLGNAFFWISFCMIGQPMGMVLYYYDFSQDAAVGAEFHAGNSTMNEL